MTTTRTGLSCLVFLIFLPSGTATDRWSETVVHDALVGALTGNVRRVSAAHSVLQEDRAEQNLSTGLDDDIAVLEVLASTGTQKEKAERIQRLSANLNDPAARERLRDLSRRANDFRLEDLVRKRRRNRFTSVINRAWQTTSQVLAGQPSALGLAAVDLAKAVTGRSAATVTDKKIAHLAQLQEKRGEAPAKDLAKARRFLEKVQKKKDRSLRKKCKETIDEAADSNDWWRVRQFAHYGLAFWPEDPFFGEALASAEQKLFTPPQTENPPTGHPRTSDDELAVLRRKIVANENPRFTSTSAARRQIQRAEADRRNRTLDYLLFGETSVTSLSERSAKTAIVHGSDAPAALAFLQAAESAFRAATLVFGNDLGAREAIDTYARIEQENPESLREKDYLRWADLYSKVDQENKAIALLEKKNIRNPRRIEKYRKRWASGIVKRCRDLPPSKERYEALVYVTENFPETKAAIRAKELLEQSPPTQRSLVRVDPGDLKTFRRELLESGFNLPEQWWDNKKKNGEIDKDSLYWEPETATLWYRVSRKSSWRKLPQPESHADRIAAVFEKIEDFALARSLRQQRATKRRFPLEIEGSVGDGTYITPKLVQYDLSDSDDRYYE